MTTVHLPANLADEFHFIIVGGGTAGCVVASRLSSYLPDKKILLVEAGPSDLNDKRFLSLREWEALIGGEYDFDYPITDQPMGNSYIRHSRAKVLGGCSSHNTLIAFRPFEYDCQRWVEQGCTGWDFKTMNRLVDKLRINIQPVHYRHRNQACEDFVEASAKALDLPVHHDLNHKIRSDGSVTGTGFLSVSYNADDNTRSSASVAYIHPILRGAEERPNLVILTDAWVNKVNMDGARATGVTLTLKNGEKRTLQARNETVICAGAIDTPRLLLLSGLGPKKDLAKVGIKSIVDIPGVGYNLIDHPETVIFWELTRPVPRDQTTMFSDGVILWRREQTNAAGTDGNTPDSMIHMYTIPLTINTERHGYDTPAHGFSITPNIPRPRSRGQLYLVSSDPTVKPALDFKYFTDPEGYDTATLVEGLKVARKVAATKPLKKWLKREVAPGPSVKTDEELSEYARKVAHSVYHPAGTCKMGSMADPMAVVDSQLRVRGIQGLSIADASVFPEMPSINPMVTVLAVGERLAEILQERYQSNAPSKL